jgi:hypothetical protein
MRFVLEVIRSSLLVAAYLVLWEPPAPVVCFLRMSMPVVLRDAKKLRVNTAVGGSLTAVDVGTGLVEFLAVCEVLLEICPLRLFISWKSSSWTADSTEVLFTAPMPCLCAQLQDGLQFIQCYSVRVVKSARNGFPSRVLQ